MKEETHNRRPYVAPSARFALLKERTNLVECFSAESDTPLDEYQDGGPKPWDSPTQD